MSNPAGKGLGKLAVRSVFWVGGGQVFRQVLGIVVSVILARLLAPEDFGLIAMVYVFIEFAQVFADFGIGAAIIQSKDADARVLSSAFWANVSVGVALALLTAAAAPLVVAFYGDERLFAMTLALSLTLLLSGASVIPRAILHKEMRFAVAATSVMTGSLAGAVTAVGLVLAGYGVWGLVWQPIVGSSVTFVLTFLVCGWRPRAMFSWAGIRSLAGFSAHVLGNDLLGYASRNADKLLIGKVLGSVALGYYSLAWQFMLYPLTHVSSVIVKVLFPTLSLLQKEVGRFRAAYLKATAAIGLVTFPAMVGLFLVAEDFVRAVFGDKWLPVLPVLNILCFVGMLRSVMTTAYTIYLSTGRTQKMFRLSLVSTPLMVAAFATGLPWGIVGVAAAYAIVVVVMSYVNLRIALGIVGLRVRDFHAVLARPFAAAVVMGTAVWLVRSYLLEATSLDAAGRLACAVIIGILVYAIVAPVINRPQIRELRKLVSSAWARERGALEST